ncbi:hypothetical protein [Micromonospora taraxaci]|uniref:hypothetical protein n=1 Tax=Micromonospora taraxaci TaxID=1316803 RepID=UPI0033B0661A
MTTAVSNAEIDLRNAVAADNFPAELTKTFHGFWVQYKQMTPEEREQPAAQGRDPQEDSAFLRDLA